MSQSRKQKIKQETIPRKYFNKQTIGLCCLGLAFLLWLIVKYFFNNGELLANSFSFAKAMLFFIGLFLIMPYEWIPYIFFDNREYDKNENIDQLIEKMRFRAVLFNNISILVFVFTIGVIVTGFWLLAYPSVKGTEPVDITIRISASVLLIFLVQILFKLFKYLLRVAAFYNGKADAIEFSNMTKDMPLDKTIDFFTPDKYDITDLEAPNFIDALKAKLGIK
jgi:hypothetical protein